MIYLHYSNYIAHVSNVKLSPYSLIIPIKETKGDDIHYDRYSIDNYQRNNFVFHCFQADNQNCCAVEMEIAEEKYQPDAFERKIPEWILPNQMSSHIEKAFNKNSEN